MKMTKNPDGKNPIPELIDNNTYSKLDKLGLLDPVGLRNYCIKKLYRGFRDDGLSMFQSLELLSGEYHLAYEYLRKIVGINRTYIRKYRMSPL